MQAALGSAERFVEGNRGFIDLAVTVDATSQVGNKILNNFSEIMDDRFKTKISMTGA